MPNRDPLPLAGVVAKKFTEVVGALTAAVFVGEVVFYAWAKHKKRRNPRDAAFFPGLIFGLSLGALILGADAIWG